MNKRKTVRVPKADLAAVVDYLWHDEELNYSVSSPEDRKGHIFTYIEKLVAAIATAERQKVLS